MKDRIYKKIIFICSFLILLVSAFPVMAINCTCYENMISVGVYENKEQCLEKHPTVAGFYPTYCVEINTTPTTSPIQKTMEAKNNAPRFKMPDFQIKIPGLDKLSEVSCENGVCKIPWISEYTFALYDYGLSIAGILGVLMLMAAGLLWIVSGGDQNKISQAKKMIFGSIVGLIILVGANLILTTINPDLAKSRSINIGYIEKIELGGDVNDPKSINSLDTKALSEKLGINCGQDSIKTMVDKSVGKISYSQKLRTTISADGYVNFDCSSYTHFLLKCLKNANTAGYSGGIFQDQAAWNKDASWLRPGDLIGWAPSNNAKKQGHVLIYMGGNQFADCHSTKQAGGCVGNLSLEKVLSYATSHSDGKLYFKRY